MSGIFKGDSIYKSGGGGGGGGGYNDGGQIVDDDFMKVENNAVSSYDNVSRDPINFYFEPADGEILNAIVELTTAVNATVNVYVLKNGFYYLLGNVGGDTVTAGNDYKVNITGDSYAIEQVTGGGFIPEFAIIGNQTVKVYASLDKTVLFTSNDAFPLKNNVDSINFATSVGWTILDNTVRSKFQAANIPVSNSGYFDGSNWQNVGIRAIIFNGPYCDSARGYENVSSNPQGGDYGTGSSSYKASLVLYKVL